MKRSLVAALALSATACWDFNKALSDCHLPGGACSASSDGGGNGGGGTGGGNSGGSGGGSSAGGSGGSPVGGGSGGGGAPPHGTWQNYYQNANSMGLFAAFAVSPNEVWFGGDEGIVEQIFDGTVNDGFNSSATVLAIAADSSQVYFGGGDVGQSQLFSHPLMQAWDGGDLSPITTAFGNPIVALWSAGSQVWASAYDTSEDNAGVLGRAPSWVAMPIPSAISFASSGCGSADDDFWIAGVKSTYATELYHYTGSFGSGIPFDTFVGALWCAGSNEVWGAGAAGDLVHVKPDGGSEQFDGGLTIDYQVVWGSGPNDVFFGGGPHSHTGDAVMAHWDGTRLTFFPHFGATMIFDALTGTGPLDVWATDATGTIWHYAP